MKKVLGGAPPGSNTCGYVNWTNGTVYCNLSKAEALFFYNACGTDQCNWCCDSCNSTTYCGGGGNQS